MIEPQQFKGKKMADGETKKKGVTNESVKPKAGEPTPISAGDTSSASPAPQPKKPPFADRPSVKPEGPSVLQVKFNADGSPNYESMTEKTAQRFKELLAHQETQKRFGVTTAASVDAKDFDPTVLSAGFDALGMIRGKFYEHKLEIPQPMADDLAKYSPEQKAILVQLSQTVLAKHSSEFLAKWNEEISLFLLLFSFEMVKLRQVAMVAEKMKSGGVPEKPNGSTSEVPRPTLIEQPTN